MAYDLNKLTKLQAIKDLAERIQSKFNALESSDVSLKGVSVVGNSLKFFTSTDTSTTPAFSIDLPAEMFLDSVSTGLVPNFAFSAATYEGATDPNLNGKPVLVLGVKTRNNDGVSETISYSFLDMSTLVDVYTASDTSIIITDYKVKVNVSADSDNMLATTANGLYVDGSGKVDKVVGTVGNVVIFAADGAVSDTGIAIATNTEVSEMLDEILGSSLKSLSFTSSSNFFSGDASTFHTFLQAALNSETGNPQDEDVALSAMFMAKKVAAIDITYSEVKTLLNDNTATFQNIVDLLNAKVANSQASDLSLSFNASTQTLTLATSDTSDSATGSLNIMGSGTYFAEYILTDINSSTHTSTGSGDVTVSAEMLYLEIK